MAVRSPETESESKILEKMLSIGVLELLVIQVGYVMCSKNI